MPRALSSFGFQEGNAEGAATLPVAELVEASVAELVEAGAGKWVVTDLTLLASGRDSGTEGTPP